MFAWSVLSTCYISPLVVKVGSASSKTCIILIFSNPHIVFSIVFSLSSLCTSTIKISGKLSVFFWTSDLNPFRFKLQSSEIESDLVSKKSKTTNRPPFIGCDMISFKSV
uniref:Uncharacterized protein n=1 Tax=Cacopsylla melanoneura TaxID=428564 RepID=A0A8D8YTQ3_9HEMI